MLSKIRRKFHAVKYLFALHVEVLQPWPSDDKPVAIFWQRGHKKSRRGQTKPVLPVDVEGKPLNATVDVAQTIELSATLYAESGRTKLTGPYQKKECKLFVMQMSEDGNEMYALLGNAVLNLAEIASPQETVIEVPVDCDGDIKRAVGRPKLTIRCRAWYKGSGGPGSLSSMASGVSGFSEFTERTGSNSDPSTLSSDPMKPKKAGALTNEQQSNLEGFDNRSAHLDSIQEIVLPSGEEAGDIADSAQSLEPPPAVSDSAQQETAEADEKNAPECDAASAEVHLTAITEEMPVTEENGDEEENTQDAVGIEDSAHGDSVEDNEMKGAELNEVEDIPAKLDAWTTGKQPHAKPSASEAALANTIADWWSMVVSLLTCIPARPKED